MTDERPRTIRCGTHATRQVAVVCTHMLPDGDRVVGFVENCPLQAWCDACEQTFLREGSMTEAFLAFNDMKVVCDLCYARYRQQHSAIDRRGAS
jgi:hypothetical protein